MESPRKIICSIYGTMESPHQTFSPPYSWRIEPELRPRSKILVFQLSIANAMSRNRFQEIKKYFHCVDNKISYLVTRWVKLFLFMKKINKNLIRFGIYHKVLSIDESMVPFYGRHSAKMFITGKPIRFGYKIGVLSKCRLSVSSQNLSGQRSK